MSWTGEYWGPCGAIANIKQRFDSLNDSERPAAIYTTYASVCYGAANRVFADMSHGRVFNLWRVPYAIVLAIRAVQLCNQVYNGAKLTESSFVDLNHYANALDIVCSVYGSLYGKCFGGNSRLRRLLVYSVPDVLQKATSDINDNSYVKPHTRAFLWLHIITNGPGVLGSRSETYRTVKKLLVRIVEQGELRQACRVHRELSKLLADAAARHFHKQEARQLGKQ